MMAGGMYEKSKVEESKLSLSHLSSLPKRGLADLNFWTEICREMGLD